jgi:hypothetical protein
VAGHVSVACGPVLADQVVCAVSAAAAAAALQESLPAGGLAPHETLALVLGAAMHDAGHPGKHNEPRPI